MKGHPIPDPWAAYEVPPTPKAFFTLSPLHTRVSDDLTKFAVKNYSHSTGGTAMGLIVVDTLALVKGRLGGRLGLVGLQAAGHTVGCVRDTFLDLLLR